ncbi:MAG: NADH-quinone oxidoreductase subunit NuoF [Opitutales bacterium]
MSENRIIYRHIDVEGWNASIDKYESDGGYDVLKATVKREPQELCAEMEKSKIKGRGGAGFPIGLKWKFLDRKSGKPIYLICNADESEPGTCKDRKILYQDPHQLIEGMMCAAYAVNAACSFIYIRGEYINGYRVLMDAIAEAKAKGYVGKNICGSDYSCDLVVQRGGGCYVCGEETGLIASLAGGRGYPRIKPPYFPAVMGLYDCPTVVNNVESLCWVSKVFKDGGEAVSKIGNPLDPGTHIWGVSGQVQRAGRYEITTGSMTLGEMLYDLCGGPLAGRSFKAIIPGGSSMKILKWGEKFNIKQEDGSFKELAVEDIPLDSPSFMQCGTAIGSCGMIVMDNTVDMAEALANLNAFYAHESCGQCTPCREGSLWISRITKRIAEGKGRMEDIPLLLSIADNICGRTICAHGESVAWPVQSNVTKFKEEYEAKITAQLNGAGAARLDNNSYKLI